MEFPRRYIPELTDNSLGLEFQITDWYIPENDKSKIKDNYSEEVELYSILIYGTTEKGETISVLIDDYEPYFYVKGPKEWDNISDKEYNNCVSKLNNKLLNEKCEAVWKGKKYLKKIIAKKYEQHFNNLTVVKKKDFWGFTNDRLFNYIKVSVKSLALYNSLKYYFNSLKKEGYKLYESNLDPFIRYIHEQNIKPCGWVKIEEYDISDNDTRCDYNIKTNNKNLIGLEKNKIAPLLIASFDIECTSSHGDFPLAKKDYKKVAQDIATVARTGYNFDKEYLIYCLKCIYSNDVKIEENLIINRVYSKKNITYEKIEDLIKDEIPKLIKIIDKISECDDSDNEEEIEEKRKKLNISELNKLEDELNEILTSKLPELYGDEIIQIGTTVHKYGSDEIIYKNIVSLNTCDKIENCEIIECKTEKKLIKEWKRIITELSPDVLIGYNIFGFDMDYIWTRTLELGINEDFRMGLGKKMNRNNTLIKQELSSSALGENILKYFDLDGIILIDLFKVMQSGYKLDSYKLDNVSEIFIGDKKDDLKPKELFEKYKGTSKDRSVIAKYCIQDCALVNKLLHKLKILENNIGMGNVCLVPLNFLFRRGQGIKIFSLIIKQCMEKGYVIPVINNYNNLDLNTDGYEGAVVLDPKEGMYLNDPIVVFDYGSLYPSSMIARDLSHDRYVLDEEYIIKDDPNIEYIDVSYDIYEGVGDKKKKVGIKTCKFANVKDKDGNQKKGVIAEILMMLLNERKKTRKKIEYETIYTENNKYIGFVSEKEEIIEIINIDTNEKTKINKSEIIKREETYNNFEKDVFDALQLAYKVTANSLYGQIGARTSPIYLKEIAACTTATGREMIMLAKKFVEDNYNADVIYGDTDSIFCKFPLKDVNNNQVYGKQALEYAIKTGLKVEKDIAKIMPYPQKLNYEKSLYPFIILSKKRYVGNLYEFSTEKFKQKSMGIVLKRRDNANIVKKVYGGIIDKLLNEQDLNESVRYLEEELINLVNGKSKISDLIISKSLRASYKDPSKIAHKVLADRIASRDPGNKPAVNDRIPYVYIKLDKVDNTTLQGDRIENPEYIIDNNLTPDYLHYITNQIMKPVLQLFALSLEELPGYDKEDNYWELLDKQLKETKEIYIDDVKRKNRIENLRLQMVKELLFDKHIELLSEPKKKKNKKVEKKELTNPDSSVKKIFEENNDIIVEIKITKKIKNNNFECKYKIKNNNKCIWEECKNMDINLNKNKEYINSIIEITNMSCFDNIKNINIKLNDKKFIDNYRKALVEYKDFVKYENIDQNLVKTALSEEINDTGIMQNTLIITDFKDLIERNDKFKLIS
jgi:DNA polymerase delta subunit 1